MWATVTVKAKAKLKPNHLGGMPYRVASMPLYKRQHAI